MHLLLPVVAAALAATNPSGTAPATGRIIWVTDGDTFRLDSGERIRIADVDAPETMRRQAKCAAEIELGKAATARARALLDGREVAFVRTGKSYAHAVARVTLGGRGAALAARRAQAQLVSVLIRACVIARSR
jgi:micrococcal nuclease